ncbi:MAG: hypothetical protein KDD58_12360 [Bdellovibrionales bacterium]|nr:hypothetical protein [Bdellovibrionales bacterium]
MSFKNLRQAKQTLSLKEFRRLYLQAEQAVAELQKSELHLIETLQLIEDNMVHRWCGYNSLFEYSVQCLKLSRAQSYMYVNLSKATRKYKKLALALNNGTVTPSKAARVLSVINEENEQTWIIKASTLPKAKLEKEIVRLNPKKVRGERSEYLTADIIEMKIPVSEEVYKMLVKVQDLLSSAKAEAVTMEEVFLCLGKEYLKKHDPVHKAERYAKKVEKRINKSDTKSQLSTDTTSEGNEVTIQKAVENAIELKTNSHPHSHFQSQNINNNSSPIEKNKNLSFPAIDPWGKRMAIPSEVAHRVHLRDQGQCRHHYPSGERCSAR